MNIHTSGFGKLPGFYLSVDGLVVAAPVSLVRSGSDLVTHCLQPCMHALGHLLMAAVPNGMLG